MAAQPEQVAGIPSELQRIERTNEMNDGQCFICESWMDKDQLVKGDDGFIRCYEHAYLNQETLISSIREAGGKMAEAIKPFDNVTDIEGQEEDQYLYDQLQTLTRADFYNLFAALEAWKAANK